MSVQKKIIIKLFVILAWMPLFMHAQKVVPGEYIIAWKNAEAAMVFEKTLPVAKGENHLFTKMILKEKLILQHIAVPVTESLHYEKLLDHHPDVLYYQKNRWLEERIIPDDPNFVQQWQYINNGVGGLADADLDMEQAWDFTTGGLTSSGDTIVVCVIDEGVNLEHPDLRQNLWFNHAEIPANNIDDDGNGYIDDYRGWNITTGNDDLSEGGSHGTPVCGIIGAAGNNGEGVSGVNWNVKIMFVKYGSATEANALSSLAYAYTMRKLYNETQGAKGAFVVVTNSSWGINELFAADAPLWCGMYDMLGEVGILSCGATSNTDVDVDLKGDMPTSCESEFLISVTNINRSDIKLTGAGYGKKSIDLGAYGHQAYTLSRSAYSAFGGTSAATPHVAGVIALMYAVPCSELAENYKTDPATAALIVKDMLFHGTQKNASLTGITATNGRLNAYLAMQNMMTLCAPCAPPAGITFDIVGTSVRCSWKNENATAVKAIRYRKAGEIDWTVINGFQNGTILEGLDFCTEYEWQVAGFCDNTSNNFSYSKYFFSAGCCKVPSGFTTEYHQDKFVLTWDHEGMGAVEYAITCKDEEGNVIESVINTNEWDLGVLDTCRWFSISVEARCLAFGTTAPVEEDIIVHTPCGSCTDNAYCAFSRKNTRDEWIQRVSFADMVNESGVNKNGYGIFLGAMLPVLHPDSTYNLEIVPGFSGNPFTEDYSVYIDYNQNSNFEVEEKVFNQRTAAVNGVASFVKIPSDAAEGITRMRVIVAFQYHDSPCDKPDFEYGEIEDYCVQITRTEPYCVINGDIGIDTTQKEEVTITYPTQDSASGYIVLLRRWDRHDYDTLKTIESVLIVNELDSCARYFIKIAPDCGVVPYYFTNEISFQTLCSTSSAEYLTRQHVLYPNPSTDYFYLRWEDVIPIKTFYMRDYLGRRYMIYPEKHHSSYIFSWPDEFPAGIYWLEILTGEGVIKLAIIKS